IANVRSRHGVSATPACGSEGFGFGVKPGPGSVVGPRHRSRGRAQAGPPAMTEAARRLTLLLEDPRWGASIALAEIPGLLILLAAVQAQLAARTFGADARTAGDELLTVDEAAKRLGLSTTWLYRHASKLPFTVRVNRQVRFSAPRPDTYIAAPANGRHGAA